MVIEPLRFTVRCPQLEQLIQAFSTGHTVSILNPRPCSFASIRLILEYFRLSDFCQSNGFLIALHDSCKGRGNFDLNMFGLNFQREVYDLIF